MESHEYRGNCSHDTTFHGNNLQMIHYLKYKMLISSISNIYKPDYNFKFKCQMLKPEKDFRLSTHVLCQQKNMSLYQV